MKSSNKYRKRNWSLLIALGADSKRAQCIATKKQCFFTKTSIKKHIKREYLVSHTNLYYYTCQHCGNLHLTSHVEFPGTQGVQAF